SLRELLVRCLALLSCAACPPAVALAPISPCPQALGWRTGSFRMSLGAAVAAINKGQKEVGLQVFLEALQKNKPPSVRECNKFLRTAGDQGMLTEAITAYEAMVARGLNPTVVTFSTLISRAGAACKLSLAERFYHEMLARGVKPDVQAMNSLINAFAKAGEQNAAIEMVGVMREMGLTPTLITYNSLIDACARAGDSREASVVFGWILEAGLAPNERSYTSLISLHARAGKVDDAFHALDEMRELGLQPNPVTYTALINACGRSGQLPRAFSTLEDMYSKGLTPNVVTWTTLIDACGKSSELQLGFSIFTEMMSRGVFPNLITCTTLMDSCLKAGELDLALQLLEHMLQLGLQPTQVTYTSLLDQCARMGRASCAAAVLSQLRLKGSATHSSGTSPEWSTQPSKASSGSHELEVELGQELQGELVQLFGQAKRVDEAFGVLESMIAGRNFPTGQTWAVLFDAVATAREFDQAVGLLDAMRAQGQPMPVNEITYGALLGACSRVQRLVQAFLVVQEMKDTGVQPTEQTYLQLLDLCAAQRESQAAIDVFEAMRSSGVAPGVESYTSLLESLSRANSLRSKKLGKSGGEVTAAAAEAAAVCADTDTENDADGSNHTGGGADTDTASTAAEEAGSEQTLMRAFLVFQEMVGCGITPDRPAYNALINSCANAGDFDRASRVLGQMVGDQGIAPDVYTYSSLLKAAAKASLVDKAEDIFLAMQQRANHFASPVMPTQHTYAHLMQANLRCGRPERVLELQKEMASRGVVPGMKAFKQVAIQLSRI
ncbi:unnamed protein product, partial [Chrysoparadoxa australica]